MEKPLIHKKYLLEKYPGKGGWTYAVIPDLIKRERTPFGWVKVKGTIDGVEIRGYKLMPIGEGRLFLPVKAEIRKKIGKEAGDWVTVILYPDNCPLEIPEDLLLCLRDDPPVHKIFKSYTEGEQKSYIDWINEAKTEDTRVRRIAKTLNKVAKGLKYHDKENQG